MGLLAESSRTGAEDAANEHICIPVNSARKPALVVRLGPLPNGEWKLALDFWLEAVGGHPDYYCPPPKADDVTGARM